MKKISIILFIMFFWTYMAEAAFEDIGYDAKAKGMGNAYYAEPAGISSIYYNPAGTSFTKKFELMGNYGMPYTGLGTLKFSTFNAAFLLPLTYHFKFGSIFKDTAIGLAINNMSFFYGGSEYYDNDKIDYYERIITINLSKNFTDFLIKGTGFGIGINLDVLSRGLGPNVYTENEYFNDKLDTSGLGLDMGLMYLFNKNIKLGMVLDNLIEPNVAFNKQLSSDPVPKNRKIGVSWTGKKLWVFDYPTVAGGVAFEEINTSTWEYRLGLEGWTLNKTLGIRAGYELSDEGMNNFTAGLSGEKVFKERHTIEINYSFVMPMVAIRDTYGTHSFSLIYKYELPAYNFEFDPAKRKLMEEKENSAAGAGKK